MSERSVNITEKDGTYQLHNSALSNFELLGLLEQITFDLKHSSREKAPARSKSEIISEQLSSDINLSSDAKEQTTETGENEQAESAPTERIAGVTSSTATDLRTRISNAEKAIRDLGGKLNTTDLSKMSDEELQTELEELTAQYKRLKNSKGK